MTLDEKRMLYVDACAVVRFFGREIARMFDDFAILAPSMDDRHLDVTLTTANEFMNTLGDLLNLHDAVDDDDEWVDLVFERMSNWMEDS